MNYSKICQQIAKCLGLTLRERTDLLGRVNLFEFSKPTQNELLPPEDDWEDRFATTVLFTIGTFGDFYDGSLGWPEAIDKTHAPLRDEAFELLRTLEKEHGSI